MVKLNHHYSKLSGHYLFAEIDRRVAEFRGKNPHAHLINLGIGDVSQPLVPSIAEALEIASREMGIPSTFKGYGPSEGYLFLREAVAQGDYAHVNIAPDEIFISDGAKNDIANIQELFAPDNKIALPNPTYPVYVDTNVMAGRTRLPLKNGGYGGIVYLACNEQNRFIPEIPNRPCEIIYLCSPNNPTGVAMDRETLKKWVRYAKEHRAVIIFDGAYETYIRSADCPKTIYEIEGAKEVAIEIRSFSKTAGFTGLRCSYTVIPHALKVVEGHQTYSLHSLWKRRHDTKFGGVPYPIQKAAAAVYSKDGQKELTTQIDGYLNQAKLLKNSLLSIGHKVYGGTDSPYLWLKAPSSLSSWQFFDYLLENTHLITVPGIGFGSEGEGFIRLSSFTHLDILALGVKRFQKL